jgi:poly(rC)-binding protein 2/3/4
MGSVIGRQGSKIKEIQEASGARLQASEAMLPGSTEVCPPCPLIEVTQADAMPQRVLTIAGVADAIHIAVYYVGNILIEGQDRQPVNTAYRPAGSLGPPPPRGGGAPYPSGGGGNYGGGYGHPPPVPGPAYVASGAPLAPPPAGGGPYGASTANTPGAQTQQIFIPNELVGSIIGKAGSKINEVRNLSACHIKILDQGAEGSPPGERVRGAVVVDPLTRPDRPAHSSS